MTDFNSIPQPSVPGTTPAPLPSARPTPSR